MTDTTLRDRDNALPVPGHSLYATAQYQYHYAATLNGHRHDAHFCLRSSINGVDPHYPASYAPFHKLGLAYDCGALGLCDAHGLYSAVQVRAA